MRTVAAQHTTRKSLKKLKDLNAEFAEKNKTIKPPSPPPPLPPVVAVVGGHVKPEDLIRGREACDAARCAYQGSVHSSSDGDGNRDVMGTRCGHTVRTRGEVRAHVTMCILPQGQRKPTTRPSDIIHVT